MQSAPRRALEINPLRQEIIFGGEKGWANAPAQARPAPSVDDAKKLEKSGAKAADIFQQTGWYHGPDGQWKWTLSDKGAALDLHAFEVDKTGTISLKPSDYPRTLRDVLDHPTLYKTYPQLRDAYVERMPAGEGAGVLADYDAETNTVRIAGNRSKDQVLSTLLHELQHGVQRVEGFGRGSSFTENVPEDLRYGKRPLTKDEQQQAYEAYSVASGEVEARQVQKQLETQNWSQLPTQMQGFPAPDRQLVRRGSKLDLGKSYQLVPVDHDPFTTTPVDYDPFKMKPVDHDPYAPPTNVYEHALQQYPILRDQGVVGVQGNGQMMESWPANEPGAPGRPRPTGIPLDKFGVEYREQDRPIDILGDVVSHHMIDKDPVIKKYYENFTNSLNDEQRQRLQEQYQYAQQNEGEARPYEQWEEKSGLPAYFRGYAFQQWPQEFNEKAYTPEQRDHLDRMMTYLQGPQESPTPY